MITPPSKPRYRGEDGLSVAEMLMTVALLGIVLTMAAQSAFGLFSATTRVEERNVNTDQNRLAIAAVSRALRAAAPPPSSSVPPPAFEVLEAQRVRFYASLGETDPTAVIENRVVQKLVEYRVAGAQLLETITEPVMTSSGAVYTGPSRTRVVAEHVRNPADEPVFTYLRENDPEPIQLPASEADREAVAGVRITIVTSRDEGQVTPAQRVTTEVRVASASFENEGPE